jgi:hypothetical protein
MSGGKWRPEPESNRRARICSPLRNHSAIGPGGLTPFRELGVAVNPAHTHLYFYEWRLARPQAADKSAEA